MIRRDFLKSLIAAALCPSLPKTNDYIPAALHTGEFVIHSNIKKFDYSKLYCSLEALEDMRNWGVDV